MATISHHNKATDKKIIRILALCVVLFAVLICGVLVCKQRSRTENIIRYAPNAVFGTWVCDDPGMVLSEGLLEDVPGHEIPICSVTDGRYPSRNDLYVLILASAARADFNDVDTAETKLSGQITCTEGTMTMRVTFDALFDGEFVGKTLTFHRQSESTLP